MPEFTEKQLSGTEFVKKPFNARDAVAEFMDKFGTPRRKLPTNTLHSSEADLAHNLIEEEFLEFQCAWDDNDLIKVADALGDLNIVIHHAAHQYGINLDAVTEEIHRSNMTKIWLDGSIRRRETDGKIMKPPSYQAARIKTVLEHEEHKASTRLRYGCFLCDEEYAMQRELELAASVSKNSENTSHNPDAASSEVSEKTSTDQ